VVKIKVTLVLGNIILSGIVAFLISWFFAEGAIGDANSITPEFFFTFLIWAIGAFLIWKTTSKGKLENTSYIKIVFGGLLLWIMIPIGWMISHFFI